MRLTQMRPEGTPTKADDWTLALDEIASPSGTVRLKALGAVHGSPLAQVDVWAGDRIRALEFLRGLVKTLEQKWGRVAVVHGLRQ